MDLEEDEDTTSPVLGLEKPSVFQDHHPPDSCFEACPIPGSAAA